MGSCLKNFTVDVVRSEATDTSSTKPISKLKRLSGAEGAPLDFGGEKDMKKLSRMFLEEASRDEFISFMNSLPDFLEKKPFLRKMAEMAVRKGRGDLLKYLDSVCAENGFDASEWLVGKAWSTDSPLVAASSSGAVDVLDWVTEKLPTEIVLNGEMAICGAVCISPKIAERLHSKGVSLGGVGTRTFSLLAAVEKRNLEMIAFWLDNGADPFLEIREYAKLDEPAKISILEYMLREHAWEKILDVFAPRMKEIPMRISNRLKNVDAKTRSLWESKILRVKGDNSRTGRTGL